MNPWLVVSTHSEKCQKRIAWSGDLKLDPVFEPMFSKHFNLHHRSPFTNCQVKAEIPCASTATLDSLSELLLCRHPVYLSRWRPNTGIEDWIFGPYFGLSLRTAGKGCRVPYLPMPDDQICLSKCQEVRLARATPRHFQGSESHTCRQQKW